jgi:hypothetical protein
MSWGGISDSKNPRTGKTRALSAWRKRHLLDAHDEHRKTEVHNAARRALQTSSNIQISSICAVVSESDTPNSDGPAAVVTSAGRRGGQKGAHDRSTLLLDKGNKRLDGNAPYLQIDSCVNRKQQRYGARGGCPYRHAVDFSNAVAGHQRPVQICGATRNTPDEKESST